ncbi:bacteriocin-like protein/natural product precursor [Chitinophaga skermanii]|uniref:Bacteriocin-like protein/natural product n=1 Tax=Chitinophaga skermanii TaxID=331697 RepID=A0A327R6F5_9BACT|nr:TIGR04149 family rSAM-modified RiPP [Chitinophaga skermanii]RAJ11163.1 bacteriocin-like protein/natural product precursor [Chitinophaga skermanii]
MEIKKLKLNKQTLSVLDDKALQNIKGGRNLDAAEASCTSGQCNTSCAQTNAEEVAQ